MHVNKNTSLTTPIDDQPITIKEHTLTHKTPLPVSAWNPFVSSGQDGIWGINGKADDSVYTYLGVGDTKIEHIDADKERSSVHIYKKAFIDSIDTDKGEHYIHKEGYAAQVDARGTSVLHVYGHVCRLNVYDSAQVMLYEGAYVDNLRVYDGAVRIYKGAGVYCLDLQEKAKVVASTKAEINKVVENGGVLGHFPEPVKSPLIMCIHFNSRGVMSEFCMKTTEEYMREHRVKFNAFEMGGISNCTVTPDFEGGYNVWMNADNFTKMSHEEIERNVNNALGKEDSVTVWIDGKTRDDSLCAEH